VRNNKSTINVYKKNNIKSGVVTQLLYGDTFKKIKEKNSWIKIKNDTDNYKGYIIKKKFLPNQKNTHKIDDLYASIYSNPNNKSKTNKKMSFGSKIKVIKKQGSFYKFDNFWIKKKFLKKINYRRSNIFKNIKIFVNIKYKWGGKNYNGLDCSGLVQLFLNFNNIFCPRDTSDQIKYFKKKIKINKIKKNDLIFWKGHVAIVISKTKAIHAYGPLNKVVIMPIKQMIARIHKTANLNVIGIRRIS
jgi:hypothetical protein